MEDICRTTTSMGPCSCSRAFTSDPDHAAMLAERLDVGQLIDP